MTTFNGDTKTYLESAERALTSAYRALDDAQDYTTSESDKNLIERWKDRANDLESDIGACTS